MTIRILDPTAEQTAVERDLPARPSSLAGARVGVLSNGKEGTRPFFAALETVLRERFAIADFEVLTKSNYSAPAEGELIERAEAWDLAVTGLGD